MRRNTQSLEPTSQLPLARVLRIVSLTRLLSGLNRIERTVPHEVAHGWQLHVRGMLCGLVFALGALVFRITGWSVQVEILEIWTRTPGA
jgi:hypothetical protein